MTKRGMTAQRILMTALLCLSGCIPAAAVDAQLERRVGQLLDRVMPTLERTVGLIDRHDSLPKKSINPFDVDQRSNQSDIDDLLDKAIEVLAVSEITEIRDEMRNLQSRIREGNSTIAEYRRKRIAAPNAADLSRLQRVNPLVSSREEYDELIAVEEQAIVDHNARLKTLQHDFKEQLLSIGIEIDDAGVEALLGSVSGDEFVSMLTVFQNIQLITAQLQALTEESGESLDVAKRYYGMYVVLVQTMDRLQKTFVDDIEKQHIPKLQAFADQAQANIDEANDLIRNGGGTATILRGNIASNEMTKRAAKLYIQHLEENSKLVSNENRQTQVSLATAQNTYKTVRLSGEVAELMRTGRRNFDSLMQLRLPTIREFGNETIKKEFERMTLELRSSR